MTTLTTEKLKVLEASRSYLSRGFSVIPLEPKGKRPAIKWQEFQNHRATDEELIKWFDTGNNNIGIVTGKISGITVIDCDTTEAVNKASTLGLPTCPTVKTGKGFHFYYAYAEGVRNFQKRDDLPGIDLRGDGGYVVAPPSVHPNGKIYEWEGIDREFPPLPRWVLADKKTKATVSDLYKGVPEGTRNHTLARLAGVWVKNLSFGDTLEMAVTWNRNNQPPMDFREVESVVKSIYRLHQNGSGFKRAEVAKVGTLKPVRKIEAFYLNALLADNTPTPEPIIRDLIYPGTITLVVGETKLGKSQLVLCLARAAVSGESFLGLSIIKAISILYIGQEDPFWALRDRMKGMEPRFGPIKAAFHLVAEKGLLLEGGTRDIQRLVKEYKPDLLILDPLRRFHTRKENEGEMALVIREVDLIIKETGCAVLLVHHMRKPSAERKRSIPDISDVRGHSVVTDQANTIALLSKGEAGTLNLSIVGNYTEQRTISMRGIGPIFEPVDKHEKLEAGQFISIFADQEPMKKADAVRLLMSNGFSRAGAYKKVSALEESRWLQPSEYGLLRFNSSLLGVQKGVSTMPLETSGRQNSVDTRNLL